MTNYEVKTSDGKHFDTFVSKTFAIEEATTIGGSVVMVAKDGTRTEIYKA